MDVKSLSIKVAVEGGEKAAKDLDKLSTSAEKAGSSVGKTLTKDVEKAATSFKKFADDLGKLESSLNTLGTQLSIGFTAPVVAALGFATKAFADAEKGDARLRASIEMTGNAVESTFSSFQSFASSIQEVTDIDDDAVKGLITYGLQVGITADKVEEATKSAIGLSKITGGDLQQSMKLVALAMEGEYDMLARYVPALRTATSEAEKHEIVQKLMANGWKLATEEGKTFSGEMAMLKNQIGELGESFGGIIAEALTPLVAKVKEVVIWFKGLDDGAKKIIIVMALLVASIGPAMLIIAQMISVIQSLAVGFQFVSTMLPIVIAKLNALRVAFAAVNAAQIATAATTAAIAAIIIAWVALIIIAFADWESAISGLPVSLQLALVDMMNMMIEFLKQFLDKIETIMSAIFYITAPLGGLFGKAAFEGLQALVDKSSEKTADALKRLKSTSQSAEKDIESYEDRIDSLNKKTAGVTGGGKSGLAKEFEDTADTIEYAQSKVMRFEEVLRSGLYELLRELPQATNVVRLAITDMIAAFAVGVINETVVAFKDLGKAFADAKITGDEFMAVMGDMAKRILDMLPMLFIQAGLQLIASGQYGLGLGFVAAGMASSFVSGVVEGNQEKSTNAKGNAFSGGHVEKFASGGAFTNSIVSRPTRFNQSLMGEAGPEAIMPLTRTSDGSLGVAATGGGGGVIVNVNNYTDANVAVSETSGPSGERVLELTIKNIVNDSMNRGEFDKSMKARYRLQSVGT